MKISSFIIIFIFLISVLAVSGENLTENVSIDVVNESLEVNETQVNETYVNESVEIIENETVMDETIKITETKTVEKVRKAEIQDKRKILVKSPQLQVRSLRVAEQTVEDKINEIKSWKVQELTDEEIEQLEQEGYEFQQVIEYSVSLDTSVPFINSSYYTNFSFNGLSLNGSGQTVCVLDTGINYTHTDLSSRYLGGSDIVNDDSDPFDDNGHGTHVSGIIVSTDGVYQGVAPGANVVAAKVLDSNGDGTNVDIWNGIIWCLNNRVTYNISVISMSLGTATGYTSSCDSLDTTMTYLVDQAVLNNITVLAASGNNGDGPSDGFDNKISSPACITNVTSVGSVSNSDVRSNFANIADYLDLYAPGETITSTATAGSSGCAGSNFGTCSGTSQATPHVAGSVLLLKQFLKQYNETPNASFPVTALKESGKNVSAGGFEVPRINFMSAYRYLMSYFGYSLPKLGMVNSIEGTKYSTEQLINISVNASNQVEYCYLEVNGEKYEMNLQENSASTFCYRNHNFTPGNSIYKIGSNDVKGGINVTDYFSLTINDSFDLVANLTPKLPYVTDTLECNATVQKNATNSYYWYKNESLQSDLTNLTSISSSNLTIRDVWKCSINSEFQDWSEIDNSSVTILNSLTVSPLGNWTVDEGSLINITINVTDLDGDEVTYSVNGSKFSQIESNFTWQTSFQDSGNYSFLFNVTDGINESLQTVHVLINEVEDEDNDGVNNSLDTLNGSVNNISSINNLVLRINGSTNLNRTLNETLNVNLTDNSNKTFVSFNWNFSLELKMNFTLNYNSSSKIVFVNGLSVTNKTLFIDDENFDTLCVKNAEISSESNFSSDCTGEGEVIMTSCLGSAYNSSGIVCVDEGSRIRVENLSHSGIKGTATEESSGGSSGGGGGGGSSSGDEDEEEVATECTENWVCDDWTECIEGKQTRICKDSNLCGTYVKQPFTAQKCEIEEVKPEETYEGQGASLLDKTQENKTQDERKSPGSNGLVFFILGIVNLVGATGLLIYSKRFF